MRAERVHPQIPAMLRNLAIALIPLGLGLQATFARFNFAHSVV
jgi:hypothetical protein